MNQTNNINNYFIPNRNSSHASMESTLLIILVSTLLLILVSSQSQYVKDHFFINCGSNSDTYITNKKFIGDENPTTFKFSGGDKAINNNSTSEIYRTARVLTKKAWYQLEADNNNTFVMVNLHFSSFVYNGVELSTSKFNISVAGYTLLSNFNVENSTVIKQFIIPIGIERKFKIVFTPSSGSSYAFVNAIEAFTTPSELFKHGVRSPDHISPLGETDHIYNITSSYAFSPIYRINVGGQNITVEGDTLRRNWTSDDNFINKTDAAEKIGGTPNYAEGWADRYDAPDAIYKTAQHLKPNSLVNIVKMCFFVIHMF